MEQKVQKTKNKKRKLKKMKEKKVKARKKNLIITGVLIFTLATILIVNKVEKQLTGVVLEVDKETLTKISATISIKETGEEHYTYGEWYRIDRRENGVWKEVEEKEGRFFNLPAYKIPKNEELTFNLNWSHGYGELTPGKYRIVKQASNKEIYGEFTITQSLFEKTLYKINLPTKENTTSVRIEEIPKEKEAKEYYEPYEIESIYNTLQNKVTIKESLNDAPINTEKQLLMTFQEKSGKKTIVYLYQKDGKYYIEQPYNGIYKITKSTYDQIENAYQSNTE